MRRRSRHFEQASHRSEQDRRPDAARVTVTRSTSSTSVTSCSVNARHDNTASPGSSETLDETAAHEHSRSTPTTSRSHSSWSTASSSTAGRSRSFFDKPAILTVSGVHRGEQRQAYDQRRDELIPQHGLRLWVIQPDDIGGNARGRLERRDRERDLALLRSAWSAFERGV